MSQSGIVSRDDGFSDSPLGSRSLFGERRLGYWPWFRNKGGTEPYELVTDEGAHIKVRPSEAGPPGTAEMDLLIYCCSLIRARQENGYPNTGDVKFTVHDYLRSTGRDTGSHGYSTFARSLRRLLGTGYETTIRMPNRKESKWAAWRWVTEAEVITAEDEEALSINGMTDEKIGRAKIIKVTLAKWATDAILRDRTTIELSQKYISLRTTERRLYNIARSIVPDDGSPVWLTLRQIHQRMDEWTETRHLKAKIKQVVEADGMPDFVMALVDMPKPEKGRLRKEDCVLVMAGAQKWTRQSITSFMAAKMQEAAAARGPHDLFHAPDEVLLQRAFDGER